ncbi:MAG: ComEC family competence protein [Candidatus Microsaccharimonas sossegonensis]|uniref:ComEC family competence protein n=1 Tax=Candidatus Microsaccharimonas sossegonensis TaxID=2506948 RepID=A0A4Q0AGX8_9BACT|nr:MAG: ComEC family competence protein [Candidatus Microsaccharimonas sossegonensis]
MQLWRLRQRIHVSWVIALGCLFFVVGVWLAQYVPLSAWWMVAAGLLAVFGVWRRQVFILPCIVVAGLLFGICYGSIISKGLAVYKPLIGAQVRLEGTVKQDPSTTAKGLVVLQLDHVRYESKDMPGVIWVSVLGDSEAKRGDIVVVSGKATTGFGTMALTMFMAKIVSVRYPQPGDIGRVVRDWFAEAIRKGIPEPEASLGIGYLTGQKSALPPDLATALQIAGLTHIIVASGYNLTILVRLARRAFVKISKFLAVFSSGIMIMGFIAMTGLSPSMTRAGLVSGLSLLTWYYGRKFHPFVLLPFAAAITVLFQPSYAWGDLGWQLSFAAFAAVMIVGPLFQNYFFGEKKPGVIRQVLGETVAAYVMTIPIVVPAFGVLSNVAIPANLLIVPLVPLAMLLTFIVGVTALAIPPIVTYVGLPANWLLEYMTFTAQYLAGLPWAQTKVNPTWWMIAAYIVALVTICVYMQRKTKFSLRGVNIVE